MGSHFLFSSVAPKVLERRHRFMMMLPSLVLTNVHVNLKVLKTVHGLNSNALGEDLRWTPKFRQLAKINPAL
jgi:hypothetical protein